MKSIIESVNKLWADVKSAHNTKYKRPDLTKRNLLEEVFNGK